MRTARTTLIRAVAALAVTLSIAQVAHAAPVAYELDKAHSSVLFKIRHLLSKTPGQFQAFRGTVTIDPDKRDTVEVSATIEAASVDTDNAKRDEHLRGADFFDAAQFPTITFSGSKLTDVNGDRTRGKLEGTLTMKGVSKPVVLDVEWFGTAKDPWGNTKAAFAGTTKINRKDFGIVYNKMLDSGGYLIGDEVEIEINIEAQVPKTAQ